MVVFLCFCVSPFSLFVLSHFFLPFPLFASAYSFQQVISLSSLCMASSSFNGNDLSDAWANIVIDDEEDEGAVILNAPATTPTTDRKKWTLVGRLLTDKVINFPAMQQSFAGLWRPTMGLCIQDLAPNLFSFTFYHPFERDRIIKQGPWSYDQHLLVVEKVEQGMDPNMVPLFHSDVWVQVFDLPCGFMSTQVGRHIGDYIGKFLESDQNNFNGHWRSYMRIRVKLDVRNPLKRRMKIKKEGGEWCWVNFKYERLSTFCFYCGLMGHSEFFCIKMLQNDAMDAPRPYGMFMKATTKRQTSNVGNKWLRF